MFQPPETLVLDVEIYMYSWQILTNVAQIHITVPIDVKTQTDLTTVHV